MRPLSHIGMVSEVGSYNRDNIYQGIIDGLNKDIRELAKSQSFQLWLMYKHKDLYFKLLDEFEKEKGENND